MTLPVLEAPPEGALRIIVFGPGYGESVVLGTATSGWVVIDSLAADDADGVTVNPVLRMLQDADMSWAMLMLTHPHEDHAAGMADLIDHPGGGTLACVQRFVPVPDGWDTRGETGEDPGANETLGAKERALIAIRTRWDALDAAQQWDPRADEDRCRRLGDLVITCVWPTQAAVDRFEDGDDPNKLSSALLIHWRDQCLLLGADVLSAQWREVARAVGPAPFAAHQCLKVSHHGSKGALIEALDGTQGPRIWVLTPWDRGRKLPRFELEQGIAMLHAQHPELHLTSLPFRAPRAEGAPFRLTREQACELRESAKLPDQRAIARQLPRPVRDGWLDIRIDAGGASSYRAGPAAGFICLDPEPSSA